MDDLLLFTPSKESHMSKLEDLLKAYIEEWIKDITKEMSIVQNQPTIHVEMRYSFKTDKCVCNP